MELNNLIFAAILGCILVTGGIIYFTGIQANYAPANSVTGLSEMQQQINQSTNDLNVITQNATGASLEQKFGQDPVGALLGYFSSAFQAIKFLASATLGVPSIFLGFISAVLFGVGIFIPTWLITYIIIAVCMITFIGIMYYLTKVK